MRRRPRLVARWAAPPAGFAFPRPLVEWLLTPPRGWFPGHGCERCGLRVPLLVTDPNDPDPPTIAVFPACPGYGRRTTSVAGFEPGPSPLRVAAAGVV